MKINFKRLNSKAIMPIYATSGSACFDMCATEHGVVSPGGSLIVETGLSVEIPQGYGLFLFSRSGHGFKNSIRLANCVGVIDSDYRGEIMVKLSNDGLMPFTIAAGDRVCQGVLLPAIQAELVEVEQLSDTERGAGGFGSTGA